MDVYWLNFSTSGPYGVNRAAHTQQCHCLWTGSSIASERHIWRATLQALAAPGRAAQRDHGAAPHPHHGDVNTATVRRLNHDPIMIKIVLLDKKRETDEGFDFQFPRSRGSYAALTSSVCRAGCAYGARGLRARAVFRRLRRDACGHTSANAHPAQRNDLRGEHQRDKQLTSFTPNAHSVRGVVVVT